MNIGEFRSLHGRGQISVLLTSGFVVSASAFAILAYIFRAFVLVNYRWDWSPDEGLFLDYGLRMAHDAGSLYDHSAVPVPEAYGPTLPIALIPAVTLCSQPLWGARVLALGWTIAIALASFALVRRRSGFLLSLSSAALVLSPNDLSFWYMFVRPDGLMIALWLIGSLILTPRALRRGADVLSWGQAAVGSFFLVAAVFAKLPALVLAAPLILGWWFVDGPSAKRLFGAFAFLGLATVAVLAVSTSGGYFWVLSLWMNHPSEISYAWVYIAEFFRKGWPVLGFSLAGFAVALRREQRPLCDGAVLLVVGGILAALGITKVGAWWNYLLPFLIAAVVAGGRWWSAGSELGPRSRVFGETAGSMIAAALALALTATRAFPLPDARAGAMGDRFYSLVQSIVAETGMPILSLRPCYPYVVLGQSVEMEGTGLPYLLSGRVRGVEVIQRRIESHSYGLIIDERQGNPLQTQVAAAYRRVAVCPMKYFYAKLSFQLWIPKDTQTSIDLNRAGCHTDAPGPTRGGQPQ